MPMAVHPSPETPRAERLVKPGRGGTRVDPPARVQRKARTPSPVGPLPTPTTTEPSAATPMGKPLGMVGASPRGSNTGCARAAEAQRPATAAAPVLMPSIIGPPRAPARGLFVKIAALQASAAPSSSYRPPGRQESRDVRA